MQEVINQYLDEIVENYKKSTEEYKKECSAKPDEKRDKLAEFSFLGGQDVIISILEAEQMRLAIGGVAERSKMDPRVAVELFATIAAVASSGAFAAIMKYDTVLTAEIQRALNDVIQHVNQYGAELKGIRTAIQIHTNAIDKVKKTLEIDKFKEEHGMK